MRPLRLLLDGVFGKTAFRNEIVWCYTGPANTPRHFPRKHDTLFWYALGDVPFHRNSVRIPYAPTSVQRMQTGGSGGMTGLGGHDVGRTTQLARKGKVPEDWWLGIGAGSHMPKSERVGYPTQKPLALLDLIIKASSNPGDVVLDPFCGCATACVSAETLGRQWLGIDLSPVAATLVEQRLRACYKLEYQAHQIHPR